MVIKQKIMMLAIVLGLMVGISSVSSVDTALAQASRADEDAADFGRDQEPDCQPGEPGCCDGVKTSILTGDLFCGDSESDDPADSSIFKLLLSVLSILTAGIGIAAVGGIGYGALLYTTAENKPDQVKKAIGIMTNVVIGIVAYALMYVFLNFLIPGGIFN